MFLTLCGAAFAFPDAASALAPSAVAPPASAGAPDPSFQAPGSSDPDAQVVGGSASPTGSWPGTVALIGSDGWPSCTGTLIAPDAVLTAAHCVTPREPAQVRIGSTDATAGGELRNVQSTVFHSSYDGWDGADIAIVHLASPSTWTPIVIGADCVADDQLYDGAPIHIVGFGATNAAGTQYPDRMYEASSSIRDADCSEDVLNGVQTTCLPSLRPGGELAAGGNGVDSCYGDSGGPLYTSWQGQTYVVGVTSRGFAGQECGSGGVYLRPDHWLPWIEAQTGVLPRPVCSAPPVDDEALPDTDTTDDVPPDSTDDTEEPGPDELPDDTTDDAPVHAEVRVATLVMQKNTLGALTLDPTGALGGVAWDVVELGQASDVRVTDGVLYYSPRMGFTGNDVVTLEVQVDGVLTSVEVPIVVLGSGCDQSGGGALGSLVLVLLPLLVRRR